MPPSRTSCAALKNVRLSAAGTSTPAGGASMRSNSPGRPTRRSTRARCCCRAGPWCWGAAAVAEEARCFCCCSAGALPGTTSAGASGEGPPPSARAATMAACTSSGKHPASMHSIAHVQSRYGRRHRRAQRSASRTALDASPDASASAHMHRFGKDTALPTHYFFHRELYTYAPVMIKSGFRAPSMSSCTSCACSVAPACAKSPTKLSCLSPEPASMMRRPANPQPSTCPP